MRFFLFFLFILFSVDHSLSQIDNVGSGRAISFDGVDDRIDISGSYNIVNLPFTISAWVRLDPTAVGGAPIFVTNDNDPIYRGFWLIITPSVILCEFGDGAGGNNPAFRRGKSASISNVVGRWINVTVVMNAPFDIRIYVNGVDIGGNSSGGSSLPMQSANSGDIPKIGYFLSNNIVYRQKSTLDEIRLWNRSLSQQEIRNGLCTKLIGNEPGLIGYWDFNETSGNVVLDKSPNKFHGQLVGNPTRVYSGAPIGDVSVFSYPATTSSIVDGTLKVEASNISGAVEGIQLYEIKNNPSQTGGLDLSKSNSPYFGVFLASVTGTGSYTAKGFVSNQPICNASFRTDNSKPTWNSAILPQNAQPLRGEYVLADGAIASFDLGPDKVVCDQSNFVLATMLADPTFTYLWSTGENTPSITVTQSGVYSVKVTGPCGSSTGQTRVDFFQKPVFDLGSDKILCSQSNFTLTTNLNDPTFTYLWSTGEITSSITVTQSGVYSVKVTGTCGSTIDQIRLDFRPVFDLGSDKILCNQSNFTLTTALNDPTLSYLWSTGENTSLITVTQSGFYSVKVTGPCGSLADQIRVDFFQTPVFDLGPDKVICDQPNFVLTTMLNDPTFTYLWNTGENTPFITVTQAGIYSVKVTSPCGSATDQTRVDFFQKPVFDLGQDKILCDQTSYTISTQLGNPTFNHLWNTSQTTSSITVNQSGNYSVTVANPCGIVRDNVQIDLLQTPRPFSLGLDVEWCEPKIVSLKPYTNSSGFLYTWQDGSTNDSFQISDFGRFWVTVKNGCGQAADTINVSKINQKIGFVPDIITPNGDGKNDFFQVDPSISGLVSLKVLNRWGAEVFFTKNYRNDWSGFGLSTGIYFIVLEGSCVERFKGPLTIIR
jgi:hypothetical protein